MTTTATETTTLIALTLPSTPYSAWMARYHVRTALKPHGLDSLADDAATVTSELVTNAITHTDATTIGLEVARLDDPAALSIVVTDSSPVPLAIRDPNSSAEHGRGLLLVQALSIRWGWRTHGHGKAVFAILATGEVD